jgi:lambda repressor-like predicted transcriptional regulator
VLDGKSRIGNDAAFSMRDLSGWSGDAPTSIKSLFNRPYQHAAS